MTDGWMRAIDEALVTHHLGVADEDDSYEDAKRKLGELIDWHIAVATDPRVNGGKQLVPVEPTNQMVAATHNCSTLTACYQAMLAAAPHP